MSYDPSNFEADFPSFPGFAEEMLELDDMTLFDSTMELFQEEETISYFPEYTMLKLAASYDDADKSIVFTENVEYPVVSIRNTVDAEKSIVFTENIENPVVPIKNTAEKPCSDYTDLEIQEMFLPEFTPVKKHISTLKKNKVEEIGEIPILNKFGSLSDDNEIVSEKTSDSIEMPNKIVSVEITD